MRKSVIWVASAAFACILLCAASGLAKSKPEAAFGEKLVRQCWADMEAKKWAELEKMIAPGFQSLHDDRMRNKEEELKLIEKLDIKKYEISDVTVTEDGPLIVVTYKVSVDEKIDGTHVKEKSSPRLSAFLKTDDGWKWVAHANLVRLR